MKYQKIELLNTELQAKITLEATLMSSSGILLQNFDPGDTAATFDTFKGYGQNGSTKRGARLEETSPAVQASILADGWEDILRIKNQMDTVLNPLHNLRVSIWREDGSIRVLNGVVDGTVNYSSNYKTCNAHILEFKFDIRAFNPYYEDADFTRLDLTTWEGGLTFPVTLPFTLKHRTAPVLKLTNDGQAETPLQVVFSGPAVNPKITHVLTGQFIQINQALAANERLHIDTNYDNIVVEIEKNGIRSNGYHYIAPATDFFYLTQGDNVLKYSSNREDLINTVEVYYKRRYLGV